MLSANDAREALQELLGEGVNLGNPLPFTRGYDNISGGAASIDNFNALMKNSDTDYPITGSFGTPGSGQNLSSDYPSPGSTWNVVSFVDNGDGTATWTGTARSTGDVVITVQAGTTISDAVTGTFGTNGGNNASVSWNGDTYTGDRTDNTTPFVLTGSFGIPGGTPGNITADYPAPGSTWTGISFTDNGDGTGTWTGTAVTTGDVTVTVNINEITSGTVSGTFGTDGGNDAVVLWNSGTYAGNRTDTGDHSEVIVTNAGIGITITFEVDLNTGSWTATAAGAGITSSSGSGGSSFAGGGILNITGGTLSTTVGGDGNFSGTLGSTGLISGHATAGTGNNYVIDTGTLLIPTASEIIVTNVSTGYTITFELNLISGAWTATVSGTGVASSSGSGTSAPGMGGAIDIATGSITLRTQGSGDFTGTLGSGLGTITGTSSGTTYTIDTGTLTVIGFYKSIFYGEVTYEVYDDNGGELTSQVYARYFTQLNGGGAVVVLNAAEHFSGTPTYDFRAGTSPGMLVQNVVFAGRCNINFSGYIFSLTPTTT